MLTLPGKEVGLADGELVGAPVGLNVVGPAVGLADGVLVGAAVGMPVGDTVGMKVRSSQLAPTAASYA